MQRKRNQLHPQRVRTTKLNLNEFFRPINTDRRTARQTSIRKQKKARFGAKERLDPIEFGT